MEVKTSYELKKLYEDLSGGIDKDVVIRLVQVNAAEDIKASIAQERKALSLKESSASKDYLEWMKSMASAIEEESIKSGQIKPGLDSQFYEKYKDLTQDIIDKYPLRIILNYFRDGITVEWDDSDDISKAIKKFINSGFECGFIVQAIAEGERSLSTEPFPEAWVAQEAGYELINRLGVCYKEFLKSLIKNLDLEFVNSLRREKEYEHVCIFEISEEKRKF
jgi:hypothetical protein